VINIFVWLFSFYLFIERCTLSSTAVNTDIIESYSSTQLLAQLLFFCCCMLNVVSQWIYSDVSYTQLVKPNQWFCWCRNMLIYLVSSSICNQLISVWGCRPIETLYDIRYISMFIVQITGFAICLIFAFFLGVKYASIRCSN
jgi:hypothetical protein